MNKRMYVKTASCKGKKLKRWYDLFPPCQHRHLSLENLFPSLQKTSLSLQ